MTRALWAFLSGALFAVGLAVAGMTQPAKIVAFLDFSGQWDPSLALVMAGAIGTHLLFLQVVLRRTNPELVDSIRDGARRVDGRLLLGAATFGIGWGISGYCPGPAVVSFVTAAPLALSFVGAMALGMFGVTAFDALRSRAIVDEEALEMAPQPSSPGECG